MYIPAGMRVPGHMWDIRFRFLCPGGGLKPPPPASVLARLGCGGGGFNPPPGQWMNIVFWGTGRVIPHRSRNVIFVPWRWRGGGLKPPPTRLLCPGLMRQRRQSDSGPVMLSSSPPPCHPGVGDAASPPLSPPINPRAAMGLFLCLTRVMSWAVSASPRCVPHGGLERDGDRIAAAEGAAACGGDQRGGGEGRDGQRQPLLPAGQAETWQHSSLP